MQTQKIFIVEGQEFTVKFPTAGQILDIKNLKMAYSNNTYGALISEGTKESQFNLSIIDAVAFFTVLVPGLLKNLDMSSKEISGVKSLLDLDIFKLKKLLKIYRKEIYPWYVDLLKELYAPDEDDEFEEDEDDDDDIEIKGE